MATSGVISSVQVDPVNIATETTLAIISYKGVAKKAVSFVFTHKTAWCHRCCKTQLPKEKGSIKERVSTIQYIKCCYPCNLNWVNFYSVVTHSRDRGDGSNSKIKASIPCLCNFNGENFQTIWERTSSASISNNKNYPQNNYCHLEYKFKAKSKLKIYNVAWGNRVKLLHLDFSRIWFLFETFPVKFRWTVALPATY